MRPAGSFGGLRLRALPHELVNRNARFLAELGGLREGRFAVETFPTGDRRLGDTESDGGILLTERRMLR